MTELRCFKTMWGFEGQLSRAIEQAQADGYDGIEGPAPRIPEDRDIFGELLEYAGLDYIAEITTAGSYVPERRASLEDHLRSLEIGLLAAKALRPRFVTCLGGLDAWPYETSLEFFQRAMDLADRHNLILSFETHRSRSLFNPWVAERIVRDLPEILLTCDFSHWCVVCERLLDTEIDVIEALAPHAHHIHARVGYEQGPQVPHPAAPEYRYALEAHQRWWEVLWLSQLGRGYHEMTLTPEFGPDGYLHHSPFTDMPVADLREINRWMADTERHHFRRFQKVRAA